MNAQNEVVTVVYSIGHSDHTVEAFIALLRQVGITTLADVRSQPYSRWVPQFNREMLVRALEQAGIAYRFLGDVLGGRPADPTLYPSGQMEGHPDYARVAATPAFQAGLDLLIGLAQRGPVAMLCSEGDYHHCHRALLITPSLLARGVRVVHILPSGQMEEATPQTPTDKPQQLALF